MQKTQQLIGEIYDTVLDGSLWPEVMRKSACFIQGSSASVLWKDPASKSGDLYFHDGGIEPLYLKLYFDEYIKLNPTTTRRFYGQIGEPMATADLLPYDEFLQTRFYREWARPQCLVDFVSAVLEKSATSFAMFGVFRHERHGVVDEPTRRRFRLLTPHIRRAVLIAKVVDLKRVEADVLAQSLDGLRTAVFLVDAEGHIVHANAAGHIVLAAGDILRAAGGRLFSVDRQINASLRSIFAAAAQGDLALGTKGIAFPLVGKSGVRHVAHLMPLTSGARRLAGTRSGAAAALYVHRASLDTPAPPDVIAQSYQLTPMELRVLLAIVEVGGVPAVAETLGVAPSTVKTHLGRVYEKTGTNRQADLVKLVAGFVNPLLP